MSTEAKNTVKTSKRKRKVYSIQSELVEKSKESALAAVKIYNDPLIKFKSETFIVLMVIAWTYLLHAYYRSKRVDYRYHKVAGKNKKFDRTKRGAFKYWELERCLDCDECPVDGDAKLNLKFLIGLRHEIEHQMTLSLDDFLSGRYQACILNFNQHLAKFFGKEHSLERHLSYSLQFIELSEEQINGPIPEVEIPANLRAYIVEFDKQLTEEEHSSAAFAFRLLFTKKLANSRGQADKVIEFIRPDSELAETINKEYWVKKEVERQKFLPNNVVSHCQESGFLGFRLKEHTDFWKSEAAKGAGKGYGVQVEKTWYWYQKWLDRCLEYCRSEGERFVKAKPTSKKLR